MHASDLESASTDDRLERAQALIGYRFVDESLLRLALTHPSASDDPAEDYDRLEFLGDAVLSLIVAEEIFKRFPGMPEGNMTKLKIAVVSGTTLRAAASQLGLDSLVRFGPSEQGTDSRGMASALEDAFEALVGAIYLDAGLSQAGGFALDVLGERIDPQTAKIEEHPKSLLQEMLQARGATPVYRTLTESGPPHNRVFTVEVEIDGAAAGAGSGRSKKEAEMRAAEEALQTLSDRKAARE